MYLFNRRCHNRAEVDDCYCYCCPIFLPKSMDANGYAFVLFVVRVEEAIDVLCTDWSVRSLSLSLFSYPFFSSLLLVHLVCTHTSRRRQRGGRRRRRRDFRLFSFSLSLTSSPYVKRKTREGKEKLYMGQTLMNNVLLLIVDWSVSLEILSPDRHRQYSIKFHEQNQ